MQLGAAAASAAGGGGGRSERAGSMSSYGMRLPPALHKTPWYIKTFRRLTRPATALYARLVGPPDNGTADGTPFRAEDEDEENWLESQWFAALIVTGTPTTLLSLVVVLMILRIYN